MKNRKKIRNSQKIQKNPENREKFRKSSKKFRKNRQKNSEKSTLTFEVDSSPKFVAENPKNKKRKIFGESEVREKSTMSGENIGLPKGDFSFRLFLRLQCVC